MTIEVIGFHPIFITAVSDTTTIDATNSTTPNPDTNARVQQFTTADIIGRINAGVTVDGWGLRFAVDSPDNIGITHEGSARVTDPAAAGRAVLSARSLGGSITYAGRGDVSHFIPDAVGPGLSFLTTNAGDITVTGTGDVTGGSRRDAITALPGAGIFASADAGDITITPGGAIQGFFGISASVGILGSITIHSSTRVTGVGNSDGIEAVGGAVTVNVSAGVITGGGDGIEVQSTDTGAAVIHMTGGQIGSAGHRPGNRGLVATSNFGDLTITAHDVFSTNHGVFAQTNAEGPGDITVTVNGTVDSGGGNGVFARILSPPAREPSTCATRARSRRALSMACLWTRTRPRRSPTSAGSAAMPASCRWAPAAPPSSISEPSPQSQETP
jgi:hypothetical protein